MRRLTDARPVLLRWEAMVPTWVQRFMVRFEPARQAEMAVDTSYQGRWAILIVTGRWFDEPAHEREDAVIHELVHICLEPMVTVCARIIEDCTPESTPLRALADSTFTAGMEASVEDLARCISRIAIAGGAMPSEAAGGILPDASPPGGPERRGAVRGADQADLRGQPDRAGPDAARCGGAAGHGRAEAGAVS